jgi:hypothetical protein
MKKCLLLSFILINAFTLFPETVFGQSERFQHTPKLFQVGLRIGFINASLNAAYKLNNKTVLSADFGIGMVRVYSRYYNKYNYNYPYYDKRFGTDWNFGREWWSPYTSVQLKRVLSSRSKIEYTSSPFANTFFYMGIQLKFNAPSIGSVDKSNLTDRFQETYQTALLIGRQLEFGKSAIWLYDIYLGLGIISNYNIDNIEPKITIGLRIGTNLFSKTK